MQIEYRKADIADAELLIDIYNASFYSDFIRYGECPAYGKTKEEMEQSIVEYSKFLILCDGKPVGCVSCKETAPGIYYVGCLCVIPEYQGKGIGTAAMEFAKSQYSNWSRFTLVTPVDKTENVKFYTERCGFSIESSEMDGNVEVFHFVLNSKRATRKELVSVAKDMAQVPFHGFTEKEGSNLEPIIQPFPKWTPEEADKLWCAAFVYYCCKEAGFAIPIRPKECRTCHLAGCIAWEEFAIGDPRIEYHKSGEDFVPEAGDIVLYDRVFENREHDHIGIVIEKREDSILAAEGNIDNRSGLIERPIDEHIRAYIRIPDGYQYADDIGIEQEGERK